MQTRKLLELIGEINLAERYQRKGTDARLGKLEAQNAAQVIELAELRKVLEALVYNLREAKNRIGE